MPSERCGSCRKFISPVEGVRCNKCNSLHHRSCVALLSKGNITSSWKCSDCNKGEPKDNRNDTPDGCTNREILDEIRAMRLDVRNLHNEISDMKNEIRCCLIRVDQLEDRIEALEKRTFIQSEVGPEVSTLICQLRLDFNEREQDFLANDLEIRNIPEENSENPTNLIIKVADSLGLKLENREIVSAERIGKSFINAVNRKEPVYLRPRTLVVRLARRELRDEFLNKTRTANTGDRNNLGKGQRFFINERLTKFNRKLFWLARKNKWQFVWTKRGHILARQCPSDHVLRIRTENDITENIGPVTDNL